MITTQSWRLFVAAIESGHTEALHYLLEAGVRADNTVTVTLNKIKYAKPLIYFAVKENNLDMAALLLKKGAVINRKKADSRRDVDAAVKCAVENNLTEMAIYLLEQGAHPGAFVINDPFGRDSKVPCLTKAADNKNDKLVAALIKHGADIEEALMWLYLDREKAAHYQSTYQDMLKLIFNHAVGVDFSAPYRCITHPLTYYFREVNVAGFNFLGISINGVPLSKKMLGSLVQGANNAIVTTDDLDALFVSSEEDQLNQFAQIKTKLDECIALQGRYICEGLFNLVPLWRAAEIGDIEAVRVRLRAGINPNTKKKFNYPPIVLAAANGHAAIVELLVEHAEIDRRVFTQAIAAAEKNQHACVVKFLSKNQDIDLVDSEGRTPLHLAIQNKDVRKVKKLIEKGAKLNEPLGKTELTPLCCAASIDSEQGTDIVRMLIEAGADIKRCYQSPLTRAIKANNTASANLLMPITSRKPVKTTVSYRPKQSVDFPWYVEPMFEAVQHQNKEVLRALKECGADFSVQGLGGETILHKALSYFPSMGDARRLRSIIPAITSGHEHRFPSDHIEKAYARTIEELKEYYFTKLDFIQVLVDLGANMAVPNAHGVIPLHLIVEADLDYLSEEERIAAYEFFINQPGVDVNHADHDLCTPLHEAASKGNTTAIVCLLAHGANINAVRHDNRTALAIAVVHGRKSAVECLLRFHPDVTIEDKDGFNALRLCLKKLAQVNLDPSDEKLYQAIKEMILSPGKRDRSSPSGQGVFKRDQSSSSPVSQRSYSPS